MANNGTIDYSGVTMEISAEDLINVLLPKLVTALANNPTLLKQLQSSLQTSLLQYALRNGNVFAGRAGGNMAGTATKINQTSGKAR